MTSLFLVDPCGEGKCTDALEQFGRQVKVQGGSEFIVNHNKPFIMETDSFCKPPRAE
jgi:hypothetical protein